MSGFVVLLRGVNVGGHRKVPAADLRALGEGAGFERASTLLNSGNLVVGAARAGTPAAGCATPADVAQLVHDGLRERLGLEVDVVVVTAAELDAAVAANPFPELSASEPSRVHVTFYPQPPDPERLAAIDLTPFPETVVWTGGVGYTHYPDGAGTSGLTPAFLRRAVGVDGTARNWSTVLKLRARLAEAEGR